jgi:hypothetical protein
VALGLRVWPVASAGRIFSSTDPGRVRTLAVSTVYRIGVANF